MRIHAGRYKGHKLLPPPGRSQTRPMTGLVKKSLFGMLGAWLPEARVLDLYCGTGTLGLEALSEGAAWCAFAERDRAVVDRLRRNIQALGVADRAEVWAGDLGRKLAGRLAMIDPVDIVFVDPPYVDAAGWDWDEQVERLFGPLAASLAEEAVVVLRLPGQADCPERLGPLEVGRRREYGDMQLILLQK